MTFTDGNDDPVKWSIELKYDQAVENEVKIVTDLSDQDLVITTLLFVVERMTGVSTNGYLMMVDECRRIAKRETDQWDACPHGDITEDDHCKDCGAPVSYFLIDEERGCVVQMDFCDTHKRPHADCLKVAAE